MYYIERDHRKTQLMCYKYILVTGDQAYFVKIK